MRPEPLQGTNHHPPVAAPSLSISLHCTCTRLRLIPAWPLCSDGVLLSSLSRPASMGGARTNGNGGDTGRVRVSPAPGARGLARALSRTELASSGEAGTARLASRATASPADPAPASIVPEDGVAVAAAINGPTGSLQPGGGGAQAEPLPGNSRFSSREGSTASGLGGAARLK